MSIKIAKLSSLLPWMFFAFFPLDVRAQGESVAFNGAPDPIVSTAYDAETDVPTADDVTQADQYPALDVAVVMALREDAMAAQIDLLTENLADLEARIVSQDEQIAYLANLVDRGADKDDTAAPADEPFSGDPESMASMAASGNFPGSVDVMP